MKAPGRSLVAGWHDAARGRSLLLVLVVGLGAATISCDDDSENAPVLWLALDGRETQVRMVEQEPEPF
ncbi:MAG: hypothetical protein M3680_13860 [Myxococcota bacterium]|nr:hypothetical protein [Myxococcota bacterium]